MKMTSTEINRLFAHFLLYSKNICFSILLWELFPFEAMDPHGRDHMAVGFTTTYAISAYRHCATEAIINQSIN